jgi:hypothetical protein
VRRTTQTEIIKHWVHTFPLRVGIAAKTVDSYKCQYSRRTLALTAWKTAGEIVEMCCVHALYPAEERGGEILINTCCQ